MVPNPHQVKGVFWLPNRWKYDLPISSHHSDTAKTKNPRKKEENQHSQSKEEKESKHLVYDEGKENTSNLNSSERHVISSKKIKEEVQLKEQKSKRKISEKTLNKSKIVETKFKDVEAISRSSRSKTDLKSKNDKEEEKEHKTKSPSKYKGELSIRKDVVYKTLIRSLKNR